MTKTTPTPPSDLPQSLSEEFAQYAEALENVKNTYLQSGASLPRDLSGEIDQLITTFRTPGVTDDLSTDSVISLVERAQSAVDRSRSHTGS